MKPCGRPIGHRLRERLIDNASQYSMPRLLLITYHFPPRSSVGSLRPGGWAKYLGEWGWDVIVLTPELPAGQRPPVRIIETGFRDLTQDLKARLGMNPQRSLHEQLHLPEASTPNSTLLHTRVITLAKSLLVRPDFAKGWIPFAIRAIEDLAKAGTIDAILTTSPPATCHLIGARAKQLLQRPWIADFRDLWTQNLADTSGRLSGLLQKRLEKSTLRSADALVTVSQPWATRLQQRFPAKAVHVITNGFDTDDFPPAPKTLSQVFSITYTGQLYQGKRDPSLLLQVVQELIRDSIFEPRNLAINFYGPIEPWLPVLVNKYDLKGVVNLLGTVSRREALQKQRESQLLFLPVWSDPQETGQHSGKLFEYLGSGRPILAVGGTRSVVTELLEDTESGRHLTTKEQLRSYLIQAYGEFQLQGQVRYEARPAAVAKYTQREMARRLAELLDSTAVESRSTHTALASVRG
jgi:glycosyltransferase involved in cell wall biosynthesis